MHLIRYARRSGYNPVTDMHPICYRRHPDLGFRLNICCCILMQAIPMDLETDMKIGSDHRRLWSTCMAFVSTAYTRERADVPVARPVNTQVTCAVNTNLEHVHDAAADEFITAARTE